VWPVPFGGIEHINGNHFRGSSTFHLEGPKPVEGPDVKATLFREIGPRELVHGLAKVKPAGRKDARREFERVIALEILDFRSQLVCFQLFLRSSSLLARFT